MKRTILPALAAIPLVCALALFSGCTFFSQSTGGSPVDQVTEITLETSPSFGDITAMRQTTLSLFPDGTMTKTTKPLDDESSSLPENESAGTPEETRRVPDETFYRIAQLATSQDFMDLPEQIESDVLDGDYQYITVVLGDDSVRKGGLMPSVGSPTFKNLYSALQDAWEQAGPI